MNLSDEEQNEAVPSGGSRLKTNVAWARFYLVREGLLDSSKRGVWSLTEKGRHAKVNVEEAVESCGVKSCMNTFSPSDAAVVWVEIQACGR